MTKAEAEEIVRAIDREIRRLPIYSMTLSEVRYVVRRIIDAHTDRPKGKRRGKAKKA